MRLAGEFTVPAPRDAVFARLTDAPFFLSCIEGASDLVEVDPAHYTATLATSIAYMKFKFAVAVAFMEKVAPEKVAVKVEGTPLGMVGRLAATAAARLAEAGGETRVTYEIDVVLTGKLGGIGEPVMRSKAKAMERSFVQNLLGAFAPTGAIGGAGA